MKKVRWGLLSASRIANTFASDIDYACNAEIVAVAARKLEDAQRFSERYRIPEAIEGYQGLYNHPDIDAIYISTPHTLHYEQTKAALLAGKHVLCEKPFVVSSEQCRELIALARSQQLFLMEAMWTWFLPAIEQAAQWLNEGRIGQLIHIQADFGYPFPYDPESRAWNAELGGGCLLDMGIYPLALCRYFCKQPPKQISTISRCAPNGVESHLLSQLDFHDITATIATSFSTKLHNWAYLYGSEGYIAIPDFWKAEAAHLYQLDECIETFEDQRKGSGFEFQIEAASDAILTGVTESSVVTLEDSLAFQELMEQVKATELQ